MRGPDKPSVSQGRLGPAVAAMGLAAALLLGWLHAQTLRDRADQALQHRADLYRGALLERLRAEAGLAEAVQRIVASEPGLGEAAFLARVDALRAAGAATGLRRISWASPARDGTAGVGQVLVYPGAPPATAVQAAPAPEAMPLAVLDPAVAQGPAVLLLQLPAPTGAASGRIELAFDLLPLIDAALPPNGRGRDYRLEVVALGAGAPRLLYPQGAQATPVVDAAAVPARSDLEFLGQLWQVRLFPQPGWYAEGLREATGFAVLGALLALLLGAWIAALLRTRERARRLARSLADRIRQTEQRFQRLTELLPSPLLVVAARGGRIQYANPAARALLELDPAADLGTIQHFGLLPEDLADSGGLEEEQRSGSLRARSGRRFDAAWRCVALEGGSVEAAAEARWLLLLEDISERRQLTAQLRYQASHDALTGLLNRRAFDALLQRACQNELPGFERAWLLYLDVDQFKLINDTCGHAAGDQLLAEVARVLNTEAGSTARIARLGGDEFGLLLPGADPGGCRACAEGVAARLAGHPFDWEGRRFRLTVSIGAVAFDASSRPDPADLLATADTACYLAKEGGRNRVVVHNEDEQASRQRRNEMDWVRKLREALAEDRLLLFHQELRALHGMPSEGPHFELLLRLRRRDGTLAAPGDFLPAAERYGVMPEVDRWVVRCALAHFDALHPAGARAGLCGINLSGATLGDRGFPDFLLDQLERSTVDPGRLCFEITETAAVADLERARALILRLRALGCKVALDDFGAGMSSFGYLKNLPIDFIKIDGSFIRDIECDRLCQAIVAAITQVGHQVGVEVVAEFVETQAQIEILRGLGVDYAQGYAVHVPAVVPAHAGRVPVAG